VYPNDKQSPVHHCFYKEKIAAKISEILKTDFKNLEDLFYHTAQQVQIRNHHELHDYINVMIPKLKQLRKILVVLFKCLAIENYHYIFERERLKKEEKMDVLLEK
jgi:hypothetical protein